MPKVSVIVPIYKVPVDKLRNCINSIITQTYDNLEIILVDDGSQDECSQICDEYEKNDSRIKVIHQQNKGLSGARNTGVRNSTADWYTFIDGDDYIDSNGIEMLVNELEEDIDVICTRKKHDLKSEEIKSYPYEDKKVYCTYDELYYLKCMLLNFNGNNTSSCGKLYSRLFTDKYNIFHAEDLKQGAEDLEFNFRVFDKANKIKVLTNGFYHNVYNNVSITRSFNLYNEHLKMKCFESIKNNIALDDTEMLDWFYNRVLYSIVSSAISGFFNPFNKNSFFIQRKQFIEFKKNKILQEALQHKNNKKIDKLRRIVIFFIKNNMYLGVEFIAVLRLLQKKVIR